MKKIFYYIICWILLVVLFNIICFTVPTEINGMYKFGGAFWTGYGFITITFVIHFVYACFALSVSNKEKQILNIPLMIISIVEIVLMIVCGSICMIVPDLPSWVGIILCSVILIFSLFILLVVKIVGENMSKKNSTLNRKTDTYREILNTAQFLCTVVRNDTEKEHVNKLIDAIKYSDAVSSLGTVEIEKEIIRSLNDLMRLLDENKEISFGDEVDTILRLVEKRKIICKSEKREIG